MQWWFFNVSKNLEVEQTNKKSLLYRSGVFHSSGFTSHDSLAPAGDGATRSPVIWWTGCQIAQGYPCGKPNAIYHFNLYHPVTGILGIVYCCFHMDEGERDIPNDPKLFVGKVTTIFGVLKWWYPFLAGWVKISWKIQLRLGENWGVPPMTCRKPPWLGLAWWGHGPSPASLERCQSRSGSRMPAKFIKFRKMISWSFGL